MTEISCKLLVIGAGPGGYTCAIRAGQLGIDTIVIEAERPGGTCLNVGCIPSKALIHAAGEYETIAIAAGGKSLLGISTARPSLDFAKTIAWKDGIVRRLNGGVAGLLKKAGVRLIPGHARFRDGKSIEVKTQSGSQMIHAEAVVIATGSEPIAIPTLPFGGRVISSTEALALTEIPDRLIVVGGGYIGLELGTAFAKMGAAVTVVEAAPRILPQYDAELSAPVGRRLAALGVGVLTGAKAKALVSDGTALAVETADGQQTTLDADKILVTVGRRPVTSGFGLETLDLDMNGSFIRIDDRCCSSMRGVFAIGDVTGEPMLAHRAMAQGEMVAEIAAGRHRAWDRVSIPAICFTDPEIVTVGLSPSEASGQSFDIKTDRFPFKANGRALTLEREDGFIRTVARADNHVLLGIQGVGAGIAELSAAFSLALEMGARLEDVAFTIHAHPTQSEAFHEAALKLLGHAIHI
ncbi:dihydrolipoamide dehydrogenase [Bradyrhizobium sp. CCBAU 51745]|uniref:dihydrolipoyl dehydrogenase n=1 Tax=Bradyrhizobium sp. CCBAU 51745 TaxID=1325099 RepID=UPI00230582ED|nr:dihydrolipoyl dehydrogenase [Bradyrhizobium sp. CCBAU 51745]MDA9437768.1 dihydrolipoamide dehydrogenase [Bradyrhizobium sp. CCBAU 51745]